MRWFATVFCIAQGFTLCVAPLAAWAADPPPVIGSVGAVSGRALVSAPGMPGEAVLSPRDPVREGQIVRTDEGARLQVRLLDGSVLTLGGGAELRLDHLTTFASPEPRSVFTLLGGYLRAAISPLQSNRTFEVRTPTMVAGVRGTEWMQRYKDNQAEIYVLHGAVQVAPGGPQPPERHWLVQAGRGMDFGQDGPTSPVRRWQPQRIRAFVQETAVPQQMPTTDAAPAEPESVFSAPGKTPDTLPAPAVP